MSRHPIFALTDGIIDIRMLRMRSLVSVFAAVFILLGSACGSNSEKATRPQGENPPGTPGTGSETGAGGANGCTSTISSGDSTESALGQLSAGDTLCLEDGVYESGLNVPSGVTVRALNRGGAEFVGGDAPWSAILLMVGSDSSVDGLKVHHPANSTSHACAMEGTNNTMRNTSCSHGGSYKHALPLSLSGSGHLIEDSWFYGEGRYVVMCYGGEGITLRRNVARWDLTAPNEPWEPNATYSIYACKDMTIENNISLDYGMPQTPMDFGGDFYEPAHEDVGFAPANNHWLGNFAVNHAANAINNRAMRFDPDMQTSDNVVRDFYVRDVKIGFVINTRMTDLVIDKCTMVRANVGQTNTSSGSTAIDCGGPADTQYRYVDRVKTTEPIFPFENEALIKRDLCGSGERQSDWCSSGKSLAEYVIQ